MRGLTLAVQRRAMDLFLSLLRLPDPRLVPIRTVARRAPFRLSWAARKPLVTAAITF
jgi:hypothetical protein